jgi:hypothetical protein
MNSEKFEAIQAACRAEREQEHHRALAQAGGHDVGIPPRPTPGEPVASEPGVRISIPEAIELLAEIAGGISSQYHEFAKQADRVLQELESLRGQAVPTSELIALGIRMDEPAPDPIEHPEAFPGFGAIAAAATPPPESD